MKTWFGRTIGALMGMALMTGSAQAIEIINGSFEDGAPAIGTWQVYSPTYNGDWQVVSGNGIEIQTTGVAGGSTPFGDAWVELDSHPAPGSNSVMGQSLTFLGSETGAYEIEYWYRPRTNNGGDDNGIRVSILDDTNAILATQTVSTITSTQSDWEKQTIQFAIGSAGTYQLQVGAYGTENTLGGFVDNFSIAAVPEPSTWIMMILGFGFVAMRLQRKSRTAIATA